MINGCVVQYIYGGLSLYVVVRVCLRVLSEALNFRGRPGLLCRGHPLRWLLQLSGRSGCASCGPPAAAAHILVDALFPAVAYRHNAPSETGAQGLAREKIAAEIALDLTDDARAVVLVFVGDAAATCAALDTADHTTKPAQGQGGTRKERR